MCGVELKIVRYVIYQIQIVKRIQKTVEVLKLKFLWMRVNSWRHKI